MINFPIKKVILVTGANGQLGNELRAVANTHEEYEFLFTTRSSLDITKSDEVLNIFRKFRPDYCINCAAYTAVDKAESDSNTAYLINSSAISHLIQACSLYQVKLIHFSSDYVYDSVKKRPIIETDPCTPSGVYGQSKRAGEALLEESDINWICLRVSWLYSSFNHNFVKTMLRLGKTKSSLSIVNDQHGAPTYAGDLAKVVLQMIKAEDETTYRQHYNFSNDGRTNWADFARQVFEFSNITCKVKGISTEEYGATAPRPRWSVLSKEKIMKTFRLEISDWKDSLRMCLDIIECK